MTLEVNQLSISLSGKNIIREINCEFKPGVHGLLGPNGAGKTTFMRSILGLYPQSMGDAVIDNTPLAKLNIGYLPQKFGLFPNMTVDQALTYIGNLKNIQKKELRDSIQTILSDMNLAEKQDSKISTLSGGMLRRVGIAQAFLGNPPVVILDEPTAGLDPEERIRFKNYIKARNKENIIIISTHIVDDIDYLSDYIEIMNFGDMIAQGTIEEISHFADNKIFGVTDFELSNILSKYYLIKEYMENGTKKSRILSNEQISGEKLIPNLEDGYLCLLEKNRSI